MLDFIVHFCIVISPLSMSPFFLSYFLSFFEIVGNYPTDLWKVVVFLSQFNNGMGARITEQELTLTEAEKRRPVQSGAPIIYSGKTVGLNMYNKICPTQLYICAQLEELPNQNPDCLIDTDDAVACQPIDCNGKCNRHKHT